MSTICEITYTAGRGKMILTAAGHAETCPHGEKSLICAALSTLIYTLSEAMEAWDEDRCTVHTELEPGRAQIIVRPLDYDAARLVLKQFETVILGICRLEAAFPDKIHFQCRKIGGTHGEQSNRSADRLAG